MTKRNIILTTLASSALLFTGVVLAQKPERDISGHRHPNLAAAQRLVDQAFKKISEAQEANEFDMNGHAAKAKELLEQVNHELKEAAEAANKDKH
jgi:hypothetical protein